MSIVGGSAFNSLVSKLVDKFNICKSVQANFNNPNRIVHADFIDLNRLGTSWTYTYKNPSTAAIVGKLTDGDQQRNKDPDMHLFLFKQIGCVSALECNGGSSKFE